MENKLTVATIRRCKRELEIQEDIEAFERWRDTPELIDTRVLERLAAYVNEETSH